MNTKEKKTLYLPTWIISLLDSEGEKYDGPGVVAAAAINAFCELPSRKKIEKLEKYRSKEINVAYLDKFDPSQNPPPVRKRVVMSQMPRRRI